MNLSQEVKRASGWPSPRGSSALCYSQWDEKREHKLKEKHEKAEVLRDPSLSRSQRAWQQWAGNAGIARWAQVRNSGNGVFPCPPQSALAPTGL